MNDAIYERDPEYRRRAKKRMVQEEQTLGGSIRRLRLMRGLARAEFPGLDEKSLARIERGEVERPRRATLEAIAKRLGVAVDELGEY
jgi:transcriptional regulator with XRE-family HTH domain